MEATLCPATRKQTVNSTLMVQQGLEILISVTGLRGYCELWQDRLELLAAGFLTPLHHLVEERSVGLRHDDCRQRRRSGQLSTTHRQRTIHQVSQSMTHSYNLVQNFASPKGLM